MIGNDTEAAALNSVYSLDSVERTAPVAEAGLRSPDSPVETWPTAASVAAAFGVVAATSRRALAYLEIPVPRENPASAIAGRPIGPARPASCSAGRTCVAAALVADDYP